MIPAFWDTNLALLARRTDPGSRRLAAALAAGGPGADLGLRSRQGVPLPGLATGGGRPRALVSGYDPVKEAERWATGAEGGTVAVIGGAGIDAFRALSRGRVVLAFWVEPRLEVWRTLLTWEDWSPALSDDGWVPVSGPPDDWGRILADRYHPVWDGAFRTLEWRSALVEAEGLAEAYEDQARRTLEALASDLSTQARFGERWYRNSLVNLKRLTAASVPRCPGARVVVAGAGPTLEDALEDPANRHWLERRPETGGQLFATDTALPALTARGHVPDLVFCLDGQLPTYHHFVPRGPLVPVVADLASIPLLGRLGLPVVRYLSGHPFGWAVRRHFPELPLLDGSLGNVSGLALRTAFSLGARSVDTWGVDFGYRDGQAYARGTYVYDLAGRRASRLSPWETWLGRSCYGASGRERTAASGRFWDTTPLLRDYRRRWESASHEAGPVTLAHGSAEGRWEAFAADWRRRVAGLPLPGRETSFHAFVRNLDEGRRTDWWALWPLALALHRQGVAAPDLPVFTKERALSILQD